MKPIKSYYVIHEWIPEANYEVQAVSAVSFEDAVANFQKDTDFPFEGNIIVEDEELAFVIACIGFNKYRDLLKKQKTPKQIIAYYYNDFVNY